MHSVGLHAVHGRQDTTVLAIHAHFWINWLVANTNRLIRTNLHKIGA